MFLNFSCYYVSNVKNDFKNELVVNLRLSIGTPTYTLIHFQEKSYNYQLTK